MYMGANDMYTLPLSTRGIVQVFCPLSHDGNPMALSNPTLDWLVVSTPVGIIIPNIWKNVPNHQQVDYSWWMLVLYPIIFTLISHYITILNG